MIFVRRHFFLVVFVALAIGNVLVYSPALVAYFISDDFTQVHYLATNVAALLNGQGWYEWLMGVLDGYVYFRPATYALTLVDFLAWRYIAFGYHLTNLILHSLASFLTFLIVLRWTKNRATAVVASVFFVVLPVHAEAVSWMAAITDVLCGVAFLFTVLCFTLYRQQNNFAMFALSMAAFIAALASKEIAVVLPVLLLLYDVLLNRESLRWRNRASHLAFWFVLGLYFYLRIFILQSFGYNGTSLNPQTILFWLDRLFTRAATPFLSEMGQIGWWAIAASIALLFMVSRNRRVLVLGLAWILVAFLPTITALSGASDHSFYVASFGVCLALANGLVSLIERRAQNWRRLGVAALTVLTIVYGAALIERNLRFNRAGDVAATIPATVQSLHPTFPSGARLVFIGVPDSLPEGPVVYLSGFTSSMRMTFPDPTLQIFAFNKFPIWFDSLDKTFFFQVDHRRVFERQDLIQTLNERSRCAVASTPLVEWQFTDNALGWEPWNDLSPLTIREGALVTTSEGNDPYMASPPIAVPSIAIAYVEITMRVRAAQKNQSGAVYWQSTDQRDFSPALVQSFAVIADGEYHTYRADIGASRNLLLGDDIERLRFDPASAPADIALKSIRVYGYCYDVQLMHCQCASGEAR